MSESRDEAGEPGVQTGNITANQGNVATGSNISQGPSNSPIILIQNTNNPISSSEEAESTSIAQPAPASVIVPPRAYDGRPEPLQLEIAEIASTEKKRLLRLFDGLRGSRCLLFDAETMAPTAAMLFSQAMIDSLMGGYQAVCWFDLPLKPSLSSLAPLFPLIGFSATQVRQKNSLAQAITIARGLRQNPTLLVLQGLDNPAAKSLPAGFPALIEFANEDDIGRSSIVILSASQSLTSRWGAKLPASTGY